MFDRGNIHWTKYLLECGSDVNAMTNEGNTPLTIATENNDTEMINFLKQCGAKIIDVFYLAEEQIRLEEMQELSSKE